MPSLVSRVAGLAVLALFIVLIAVFIKQILVVLALVLLLLVLGALLFYLRVRLALRRFRKAFDKATAEIGRRSGGRGEAKAPDAPEVLDAEFKVKDEP